MNKKTVCSIAVLLILGLCLYVVASMGNRKSPSKIEAQNTGTPTPASGLTAGVSGTPTPVITGEDITGPAGNTPTVTPSADLTPTPAPTPKPTPTIKTGENDLPPVVIETPTPTVASTDAAKPSGPATPTPNGNTPALTQKPTPTEKVSPTPTVAPTKVPKGGNVGDDGVIRLPVIPVEDK